MRVKGLPARLAVIRNVTFSVYVRKALAIGRINVKYNYFTEAMKWCDVIMLLIPLNVLIINRVAE